MPESLQPPKAGFGTSTQADLTADLAVGAPKVVVVDDDPGVQLLMRETLVEAGFTVAVADSGAGAIEVCAEFEPDLLLLDINMPVMDGITACAKIRKVSKKEFPIIMVTSVDDAVSIQRAFNAGANDFILKPINWPLFQRRLDSVLAEWRQSRELDLNTQRVRVLVKVAPEQVMLVSKSGLIIEDLKHRPDLDRPSQEPSLQTLEDFFGVDIAHRFKQRISGVLKTGRHNTLEFSAMERGGRRHYQAQFHVDGRERVIIVVQNVDEDKGAQNEIYDLAFYDAITGLPNRNLFDRLANEYLVDAGLHGRSLVFFNLCFEEVSADVLHDAAVMRSIAGRINDCLKNCNSVLELVDGEKKSLVAHVDTGRFMFALRGTEDGSDVAMLGDEFARAFGEPVATETGPITITPRLGAATFPADGTDWLTLLHAMEAATNVARESGMPLCLNSQAATAQNLPTQDYGTELRQAMDAGQLELYYQPRMSMPDRTVTGVEVLLRWNHPMRGFVGVAELLDLAKATGLIIPLGDWILRTACRQARDWQCVPPPRISVNLTEQEFARQDLGERVIDALNEAKFEPQRIDLEFTEAALMRTANSVAELNKLKSLGVGLVLDDFGTGHTSLANLKLLPLDALKIDGSFVRELPASQADAAICEVIITMAHKLGMKAIAEGVETRQQFEFLQGRGCDEYQGFHACKPLPASEIDNYLQLATRSQH